MPWPGVLRTVTCFSSARAAAKPTQPLQSSARIMTRFMEDARWSKGTVLKCGAFPPLWLFRTRSIQTNQSGGKAPHSKTVRIQVKSLQSLEEEQRQPRARPGGEL